MGVVVSFKAPPSMLEDMNRLARDLGVSRSELIRMALRKFMDSHKRPPSVKRVVLS